MKPRELLSKAAAVSKKINQIILGIPLWLIIGLSGITTSFNDGGWKKSEKNNNYRKMY